MTRDASRRSSVITVAVRSALEVRIGLGTGEAIEDDGDFFGDPVIEAARLCALAGPGQILATELAPPARWAGTPPSSSQSVGPS